MKKIIYTLVFFGILTSCKKDQIIDEPDEEVIETPEPEVTEPANVVVGYLYTSINGESTNQILKLDRHEDGALSNEVSYSTNSLGGANTAAGGDARGDFDSQEALRIIDNYLLAVNAGGNEITVFELNRETGELNFKENVTSGGSRPVSIAVANKAREADQYWIVIGNQWNNPNVQKDGETIERYPNDGFFELDLTQPDASDEERNITLFEFNSTTGDLSWVSKLDTYVRENGGPTTVAFSDDGSKLAVATWGVAHFGTEITSLEEQHSSRVYVYDFENGSVTGERFFEEEGIAGTIGINWARNSNSIIHASNFNLLPTKRDHSLTILSDDGATVTKSQNFNTGALDDIDEACWTILSPSADRLYVSSFGGNLITPFELNSEGNVTNPLNYEQREDVAPPGDTKDMYITPDNKLLYNTGAFQSFTLNTFEITDTGLDYKSQYVYTSVNDSGGAGSYNFLGLVGFTK